MTDCREKRVSPQDLIVEMRAIVERAEREASFEPPGEACFEEPREVSRLLLHGADWLERFHDALTDIEQAAGNVVDLGEMASLFAAITVRAREAINPEDNDE